MHKYNVLLFSSLAQSLVSSTSLNLTPWVSDLWPASLEKITHTPYSTHWLLQFNWLLNFSSGLCTCEHRGQRDTAEKKEQCHKKKGQISVIKERISQKCIDNKLVTYNE